MASIRRVGKDSLGVPIWDVIYRRTPGGRQVHRRIHAHARADVERQILLDSERSGIGLKWSEGAKIYLAAKGAEGCSPRSLEHVQRAADVFVRLMGDRSIEDTAPNDMRTFMTLAAEQPVSHKYSGKKYRLSGPKVANHHRKELLTVARYLRAHTGKIAAIPFEHIPPLPVKVAPREPIPPDQVTAYLDALPPHIRRPVMMVLYYGLRSSAVCNIAISDVDVGFLTVIDKGDMRRRIPVDAMLAGIVEDALAYRNTVHDGAKANSLFVTAKGTAWTRCALLMAAQRAWIKAGLAKKKIHEVRHTLGTVAGKYFSPGMVQAAMGHRSRKSAEAYFHPSEDMAAEVRQKIVTELSQTNAKSDKNRGSYVMIGDDETGVVTCPHCGRNIIWDKGKGRKP